MLRVVERDRDMIGERGYHPAIVLVYALTVAVLAFWTTTLVVICAGCSVVVLSAAGAHPKRSHVVAFGIYICIAGGLYAVLGLGVVGMELLHVVESFGRLTVVILLGLWLVTCVSATDLYLLLHRSRLSTPGLAVLVALISFPALRTDVATIYRVQAQALRFRRQHKWELWVGMLASAVILLIKRATEIEKAYLVRRLGREPAHIAVPQSWKASWRNGLLLTTELALLVLAVLAEP